MHHGLAILELSEHYDLFTHHGINSLSKLSNLTEDQISHLRLPASDKDSLLRGIALVQLSRSINPSSAGHSNLDAGILASNIVGSTGQAESGGGQGRSGKRKYQRRPRRDPNAPPQPPSAFVVFRSKFQEHLPKDLSFGEKAKRTGDAWQALSPEQRGPMQEEADAARTRWKADFEEYKKSTSYREYCEYLSRFKEEMSAKTKERTKSLSSPIDPTEPSGGFLNRLGSTQLPALESPSTFGAESPFSSTSGRAMYGAPDEAWKHAIRESVQEMVQ